MRAGPEGDCMRRRDPHQNKTAPRVRNGKVHSINRYRPTPSYWTASQPCVIIDREPPGKGYKHYLRKRDILNFIEILPDWEQLSQGLNAILLAQGEELTDGWYAPGVVAICAWSRDPWRRFSPEWYFEHQEALGRLNVECRKDGPEYLCKFDSRTIRDYQLLHVLLHELGHHHDRINTRSQNECSRGEPYAEEYGIRWEKQIWERYTRVFD